jgi:hypothetical protein
MDDNATRGTAVFTYAVLPGLTARDSRMDVVLEVDAPGKVNLIRDQAGFPQVKVVIESVPCHTDRVHQNSSIVRRIDRPAVSRHPLRLDPLVRQRQVHANDQ